MTKSKSRLGRGLESLISGGVGKSGGDNPAVSDPEKEEGKKDIQSDVPEQSDSAPVSGGTDIENLHSVKPKAPTTHEDSPEEPAPNYESFLEIPIRDIIPSPNQPRRDINKEQIIELAESIRSEGLIQPIVVRQTKKGYELIAGERRWRACDSLNFKTIQARVMEASDSSAAVISLIENLQRENLNPVDEASGYACLIRDFDLTQEAVAERVGKGRASITNSLRLLQLDRETQGHLAKGLISAGHAKVLLGLGSTDQRKIIAHHIIEKGLSVRETERLIYRLKARPKSSRKAVTLTDEELYTIRDLEKRISNRLKTSVSLKHTAKKGRLIIEYFGNDDLQRILEKIGIT